MENEINITKCDNQLQLMAINGDSSYVICNIMSGYSYDVNVKISLSEGVYVGPLNANGLNSKSLEVTGTVAIPKGNYSLIYVGLNWGGPYNFDFSFHGKSYQLVNDPSKPLFGAIWNLGNDSIPFTI